MSVISPRNNADHGQQKYTMTMMSRTVWPTLADFQRVADIVTRAREKQRMAIQDESRTVTIPGPSGGVRYVQVDMDPPQPPPPIDRGTMTEQEPTHEYRAKRNEIRCRVCGALRANPIHF